MKKYRCPKCGEINEVGKKNFYDKALICWRSGCATITDKGVILPVLEEIPEEQQKTDYDKIKEFLKNNNDCGIKEENLFDGKYKIKFIFMDRFKDEWNNDRCYNQDIGYFIFNDRFELKRLDLDRIDFNRNVSKLTKIKIINIIKWALGLIDGEK